MNLTKKLVVNCCCRNTFIRDAHSKACISLLFENFVDLHVEVQTAKKVVRTLGGIPLAIEQAQASISRIVPLDEFLGLYESHYQELMAHKPERSAWSYEKNRPILSTFNMLLSQLRRNHDALNLINFASCFGSLLTPMSLLDEVSDLEETRVMLESSAIIEPPATDTSLVEKMTWLKAMSRNRLRLSSAISYLEDLCLLKTRGDVYFKTASFSIHGSICTWRLETLTSVEREDWIILAAYYLSQHLPEGELEKGVHLKFLPFVQRCRYLIQKFVGGRNLRAPSGRLCKQYGALTSRLSRIYLGNGKLEEAEEMLTAAIEYQIVVQDLSWPKDRASLTLLEDFAETSWRQGKLDRAAEAFEKLVEACPKILVDGDDLAVSVAARLRNIKDRKVVNVEGEERGIIASQSEKRGPNARLDAIPVNVQPHVVSDEEWTLSEVLKQSEEEFGATDQFTIQAVRDLAEYRTRIGAYSTAIPLWERLRQRTRVDEGRISQGILAQINLEVIEDLDREILCRVKSIGHTQRLDSSFSGYLACVAFLGRTDNVRDLILLGAKSSEGNLLKPLLIAIKNRHVETVACILESGIDVNMTNPESETCLMVAYRYSSVSIEIIELLLNYGANVNAKDHSQLTALHLGIRSNSLHRSFGHDDHETFLEKMELLLENGAEVNTLASDGRSPLSDAVLNRPCSPCSKKLIKKLLTTVPM